METTERALFINGSAHGKVLTVTSGAWEWDVAVPEEPELSTYEIREPIPDAPSFKVDRYQRTLESSRGLSIFRLVNSPSR